MEIRKVLTLSGPNFWSRYPVLEAWVDLQELKDSPSEHHPGVQRPADVLAPHDDRTSLQRRRAGRVFQAAHRRHMAGPHSGARRRSNCRPWPERRSASARPARPPKKGSIKSSCGIATSSSHGPAWPRGSSCCWLPIYDRPYDVSGRNRQAQDLADRVCLGPSTAAIVKAAEARGIPARRLNSGSLVQLGQGARQRRIWTAETDRTSAIAESIAQDKELTKTLLRAGGVPVPEGRIVVNAEDAWEAACDIGLPVVVKPRDANHARGVFTNLTTQEQVESAYHVAPPRGERCHGRTFCSGKRTPATGRGQPPDCRRPRRSGLHRRRRGADRRSGSSPNRSIPIRVAARTKYVRSARSSSTRSC